MNSIKRLAGYLWAIMGPAVIVFLCYRAYHEFATAPPEKLEELGVFWPIIIVIFLPIAFGFMLFGLYAINGRYDQLD
jgi:hypothetical protein